MSVVRFFDAHGLSGKDLAEIDFFLAHTDATVWLGGNPLTPPARTCNLLHNAGTA
jgi:hypothetical protein